MKNTFLHIVIFLLFSLSHVYSQQYIGSTYLESYTKEFLTNEYGFVFTNGIDLYRINYTTKNLEGEVDTASGLVILPDVKEFEYSVVVYHHGTVGSRYEVPSYGSFEAQLPSLYAGFGFITLAPDYLGLGDSKGFHPYVHAASQAWTTTDMLIAAEAFYAEHDMSYKKRALISGYSQGGHAGMGAHRLLESEDFGYEVVAAAHMSGPYDLSTTMKELLLSEEEYPLVAYMPFVALSYDEAYGIFDGNIDNFFLPQYSEEIMRFYNEEIDLWTLNTILLNQLIFDFGKATPSLMLADGVLDGITTDEDHPVNIALRDNDVYDWTPTADTKLLYCGADEQVAFQNSLTAESKMLSNGALKVQAIELDPNADHAGCVTPAVTTSLFHFLGYRDLTSSQEEIEISSNYKISPNPASSEIKVLNDFNRGATVNLEIVNLSGQVVWQKGNVGISDRISIDKLTKGLYFINGYQNNERLFTQKLVKL